MLSAICIIVPTVTFTLYVKYNNLLSADDRNDESNKKKPRIDITVPLLIPSSVLGIRTLMDIDVTGWVNLVLWSAGLLAVILLALFIFTKEYKRRKAVAELIVFIALYFAPSTVLQINVLYDYSDPVVYTTELLDKDISSGKGKTYYNTVEMEDGSQKELKVSPEFYNMQEVGDSVTVVESDGLLGIGYVYIDEG